MSTQKNIIEMVLLSTLNTYVLVEKYKNEFLITHSYLMLLSHLGEYACEWVYHCNSAPIRNDRKTFVGVCKHSWGIRKHSRRLAKIRHAPKICKKSIFATYL